MNIERIKAVASRNGLKLSGTGFFALSFIVPVVLMILFGYRLSFDGENLPFAITSTATIRL
ncbi:MAG: hypothetical protein R2875_17335 [Desulfobacterales bacterium]